jgi:hypothetical protein
MVHVVVAVVQVAPPGEALAVYPVTGGPPLAAGAVQDTTADESPAVADTPVEAAGAGCGVTDTGGLDAGPAPIEFLATTVTV